MAALNQQYEHYHDYDHHNLHDHDHDHRDHHDYDHDHHDHHDQEHDHHDRDHDHRIFMMMSAGQRSPRRDGSLAKGQFTRLPNDHKHKPSSSSFTTPLESTKSQYNLDGSKPQNPDPIPFMNISGKLALNSWIKLDPQFLG